MKIRIFRLSNVFAWSLAALLVSLLFYVSQSVQQAEDRLAVLERDLAFQTETIRVLEVEWDYLNSPGRLEGLAKTYLRMDEAQVETMMNEVSDIPEIEAPVIPKAKPVYVSAKPAKKEKPKAPESSVIQNNDRQNFNDLLNTINSGAGE